MCIMYPPPGLLLIMICMYCMCFSRPVYDRVRRIQFCTITHFDLFLLLHMDPPTSIEHLLAIYKASY